MVEVQITRELIILFKEGEKLQNDFVYEYRTDFLNHAFVRPHYRKYKRKTNIWIKKVSEYLEENFPDSRYVIRFSHPDQKIKPVPEVDDLIVLLSNLLESHLQALKEIIDLLSESDIKPNKKEVVYEVTYSEHSKVIKLNNIQLSNPHVDSKAMNFFEYVYTRPNKLINVADIEKETGFDLSKDIQNILRDLGFKRSIRQNFFPIATKTKVQFINPITKSYAEENDLPSINFSELTRRNEK